MTLSVLVRDHETLAVRLRTVGEQSPEQSLKIVERLHQEVIELPSDPTMRRKLFQLEVALQRATVSI